MIGILIFNDDRPNIALENGTLYGGLHCGNCFRYYNGRWIDVRLEYTDNWVLVCGRDCIDIIYGTQVDI